MVTPLDTGMSALTAFSKKMSVTANNIANVNTDGFKKSRTDFQEAAGGGVEATASEVDTPGSPRQVSRDGETVDVESSNVDLAEELTETIPTTVGYKANLKAIQSYDDMLGSLLDIVG